MTKYDQLEWDDVITLCDVVDCEDCPRRGDDCDGECEEEA